jgi:hypothetical protein
MGIGATLLAAAMWMYPGGTVLEPRRLGHSFWSNLLCELTAERAVNGAPNVTGARLAQGGMLMLAAAVGVFWIVMPTLFARRARPVWVIRGAGTVSTVGLMSVPYAAGGWHALAILAAALPALLAGVTGVVATARHVRDRALVTISAGTVAVAAIDCWLYARKVLGEARPHPLALAVFQRLGLLFMLGWMGAVAWRVLRPAPDRRSAIAESFPAS